MNGPIWKSVDVILLAKAVLKNLFLEEKFSSHTDLPMVFVKVKTSQAYLESTKSDNIVTFFKLCARSKALFTVKYRITEWFGLELTSKVSKSNHQPPLTHVLMCHFHMNTSRHEDSIPAWTAPSNAETNLSRKKFSLKSNLNLSWCSLRLFALLLSHVTWEKSLIPTQ